MTSIWQWRCLPGYLWAWTPATGWQYAHHSKPAAQWYIDKLKHYKNVDSRIQADLEAERSARRAGKKHTRTTCGDGPWRIQHEARRLRAHLQAIGLLPTPERRVIEPPAYRARHARRTVIRHATRDGAWRIVHVHACAGTPGYLVAMQRYTWVYKDQPRVGYRAGIRKARADKLAEMRVYPAPPRLLTTTVLHNRQAKQELTV